MGRRPLAGIRVLDLTNVLAGPFCCHQLAHLGAEVIKIEPPGRGDLARQLGADAELNARHMGVSFLAQNAGKKSITLNLKHAEGKRLLKSLVGCSDVVVENFRPGVMERLGLDYDALKNVKPEIIYCAISGFGQSGPWVERPAYDQIIQGVSGVMSITGDRDSAPLRVGYPICDTIGGLTAAFAVASALNANPRGTYIDVSMLESTIATMGWVVSNYLIAGVLPEPLGNENATSAPSGAFRTGDGLLNIAANKQEQWIVLVDHLGRPDLKDHPKYLTREDRKQNRRELTAELETSLAGKSALQWSRELNAIGVPAGPVMDLPDVLAHAQIRERGMLATFHDVPGVGQDVTVARTGLTMDGEPPSVDTPPPRLGQHNALLRDLIGLNDRDLARLKDEGII